LLNGSKTSVPSEMKMAMVCEKMSWTYEQYQEQPEWFISTLLLKWACEHKHDKQK